MDSSPVLRPSDKDNQLPSGGSLTPQKAVVDSWEHIRALDEVENWVERTQVLSRTDHLYYTQCAQEFLDELVDNLPVFASRPLPQTTPPEPRPCATPPSGQVLEEYQYMSHFSDQDFQITASQFDMDFLEQVTSTRSEPSALARESLYVKFDPLVGGASPKPPSHMNPHLPAVTRVGRTPSADLLVLDTPPQERSLSSGSRLRSTSPLNVTDGSSGGPNKSRLPGELSTSKKITPHSSSLLDASPVLASAAPQPPPPSLSPPTHTPILTIPESNELVKPLKFGDEDVQEMVEAARKEERSKMEEQLALLREELSGGKVESQRRVERAQREAHALRTEVALHVADKGKLQEEVQRWRQLCEAHERTESEILEKHEELKATTQRLEEQRDQTLADFESLEKAFADLHQRYLKLKTASQTLHKNEEHLKQHIAQLEEANRQQEERFQQLQRDVQDKLIEANQTFESLKREHASEVAVIKANAKKLTLQVASQERALQQKDHEKQELSQICDDLMRELGSRQN